MMGLFIVRKLLLITFALQSTEEKWKMHATAEPDNSVRYGEFCLRISDDSHRTSSKSVTQQPTKSARQAKQTTQQPTTEPDHFLDTDKPEEISQPYTEKPNDIIVPLIAPHNFQSHGGHSKMNISHQSEPEPEPSSYEEPPTPLDPTTELAMTTHPSVTESKQHDPTPQMTQTPQHTTHVCESCNFTTNLDAIDPKAVQSINVKKQSFSCPVHINVSLKDEDFCLDLDLLEFNAMLMKLDEEILSRDRDGFVPTPKNISSCHCQETEQKPPTETSPATSTRIWLPSETCNSTEFIETLMDGTEVCVIGRSIFAYLGVFPEYEADSLIEEEDIKFFPKNGFICLPCIPFPNWHNIEPNDVQFMKIDMRSRSCPIYIHVTLKNNENFCVDSSQPWFRTLLEKLKI